MHAIPSASQTGESPAKCVSQKLLCANIQFETLWLTWEIKRLAFTCLFINVNDPFDFTIGTTVAWIIQKARFILKVAFTLFGPVFSRLIGSEKNALWNPCRNAFNLMRKLHVKLPFLCITLFTTTLRVIECKLPVHKKDKEGQASSRIYKDYESIFEENITLCLFLCLLSDRRGEQTSASVRNVNKVAARLFSGHKSVLMGTKFALGTQVKSMVF